MTEALDGVTTYSYDEASNKLTQTDAEGRTTGWTYDSQGRVISRTLPMGQTTTYGYDLNQRLTQVAYGDGTTSASNESAWGTSRFATKGNNFFGQWCFENGCGLVPNSRESGKTHEVADFDSLQQSVLAYMQNLNRHPAYEPLRKMRTTLRVNGQPVTGYALAAGLGKYSERGVEYIEELRAMMRHNELAKHDL